MLQDCNALVTGSAKRVGRAIALELARAGCHVAIHYRDSAHEADEVAREVRNLGRNAATICADLRMPQSHPNLIAQSVAALGGLDILINSASMFLTPRPDSVEQFSLAQWDEMLRVNLTAPAALSHHAHSHLAAKGRGRIINLTDISAVRPWKNHLAYCVSKAGLDALTRALALSFAPNISVNAVALGVAVFPDEYSSDLRARITQRVPMQRESNPPEVARFVRMVLESDDYLTGQVIPFDGGRSVV